MLRQQKKMKKEREYDMTTEKIETGKFEIYKTFGKYVSLNIFSMIGLSFYILIDTFFVANGVGEKGLIGLNIALPVYGVISGFGLMLGIGGATRYSIAIGEGKKEKGTHIFMQVLWIWAVLGCILTIAGVFFSKQIVILLGADQSILPYANNYLKTILCCSYFLMLNNILVCFVRNDGNPKLAMMGMLTASASNTVMDYIFIYPMKMGMFGAAFATGMAPLFSMGVLSIHFIRKRNGFHLKKIPFEKTEAKNLIGAGISSFITELSSGIVLLTFNVVILGIMGNVGVGAYGIITNIALVCIAIFNGVAQGIQPIISFYFGAGEKENIKKIFYCGCALAVLLGILFYCCGILFRDEMIYVFNGEQNQELAEIAREGILIYFSAFLLSGVNVVSSALFSCIARPKTAMIISLTRGFFALLPIVLILPRIFGMVGVWMSVPIVEIVTFILAFFSIWKYFTEFEKRQNKI